MVCGYKLKMDNSGITATFRVGLERQQKRKIFPVGGVLLLTMHMCRSGLKWEYVNILNLWPVDGPLLRGLEGYWGSLLVLPWLVVT